MRKTKTKIVTTKATINTQLIKRMDALAKMKGRSRNALINEALIIYIEDIKRRGIA
jgi:predicted DNA-binding protein